MRTEVATIGDDEARLLVHRAGGTPVYAYSREALRAAVRRVRAASVRDAHIYYSLKANPHPGVVNFLSTVVDGFDVCSTTELETALDTGTPPESVLFTGPAKSRAEAAAGLAAGVAVTVESPSQARLFVDVAAELGVAGRAVVRLNTPYPPRAAGGPVSPNQFGVSAADYDEVAAVLRGSPVELAGLQVFWGSQYFDADVILAARKAAWERAAELAARRGGPFGFLSLGGGIGMPWRDGEPDVDWSGLGAAGLAPVRDRPAEVVACEYGRSVVGPAGSLITTVLDVKVIDGRRYVLVDAGMNHVMIASRLVAGSGRGEPSVRAVGAAGAVGRAHVTGPLCSQLDVLAEDVPLPEVAVGDLLVFSGVGAYGPSFSPAGFLSRDPVREVVH